jgi:hypothetical protein
MRVRRGGVPEEPQGSGLAALFNAFDVAGVYFNHTEISRLDETGNGPEGDFSYAAPDLRFVGVGGGHLDALIARDLDLMIRRSPEALARAGRSAGPAGKFTSIARCAVSSRPTIIARS